MGWGFMLTFLSQIYKVVNNNIWIMLILFSILVIIFFVPKLCRYIVERFFSDEKVPKSMLPDSRRATGKISFDALEEIIDTVGYAYNPQKDIFFSTMEAWQRKMGYCRLYDEGAAPLSMIIDSEPIYFSYGGKRWLIEFWKGQYGMTTGCEVGVYTTNWPNLNIPGVFNGTFYNSVSNRDLLYMACYLKKNEEVIISRKAKHWWLTGFKLGEFSEPSDLILDIYINFKNKKMRNVFLEALMKAGYTSEEFEIQKTTVAIRFDKPHTKQPHTRTALTDSIAQKRNKMFCDSYTTITGTYSNLKDKLTAVKEQSPELYTEAFKIGKTMPLFDTFEQISSYLNIKNKTPQ